MRRILNYLNLYGPHPIIEEYIANYQAEDHDPKFVLQDLTNDRDSRVCLQSF